MAAGISQRELGEVLDLDQATVSRLERGEIQLREGQIRDLAKRFKVSADVLVGLEDVPSETTEVAAS